MNVQSPKTVTVVGAGLVGALWSVFLARRGNRVRTFERRPDMRKEKISAGRSINLALSTRGIHALRQVGIADEVLAHAVPMRGRMMHSLSGELSYQPYGQNDQECIYSISRGGLNQMLLSRAESTGKVELSFHQKVTSIDWSQGRIEFADEKTGRSEWVQSDFIFGTDGSGSAVRAAMSSNAEFQQSQDLLDYGYKEFHIPPGADGSFLLEKHALHIWPRGNFMLIALPNEDGSFTCTLFLPFKSSSKEAMSFDGLKSAEDVLSFFKQQFNDVVPLLGDVAGTFFSSPTGQMVTVRCAPWSFENRALILGDAAHAIVPFFGQGMNCGFEDCTLLDAFMDEHPADWAERIREFAQARKPDADAIAALAIENFIEMRDKVAQPQFLLEKAAEKILQREFAGRYWSRYSLVTFNRVPYRVALQAGHVEDEILAELCQGLEKPEHVNLQRAGELIQTKLEPVLAPVMSAKT